MSKKINRREFVRFISGVSIASYLIYHYASQKDKPLKGVSVKEVYQLGFSIGCAYTMSGFEILQNIRKKTYKDVGFDTLLVGRFYISKKDFILARRVLVS